MRSRNLACGLLVVCGLLAAAAPAGAFGRRQAGSCAPAAPVYYPLHYPSFYYCPPCPPPVVIPTGVDCVCNRTQEALRVHITSGFGHAECVVPPGHCYYFLFRKDNMKDRVLTAFTLGNDLVADFAFPPLDQTPLFPNPACLEITGTTAAPTKAAPQRQKREGAAPGQPSNPAL